MDISILASIARDSITFNLSNTACYSASIKSPRRGELLEDEVVEVDAERLVGRETEGLLEVGAAAQVRVAADVALRDAGEGGERGLRLDSLEVIPAVVRVAVRERELPESERLQARRGGQRARELDHHVRVVVRLVREHPVDDVLDLASRLRTARARE